MSGANRSLAWLPFRLLPTDAALVAVTPLHALHVVEALVDLRRRGRRVATLIVDTTDLLPTDPQLGWPGGSGRSSSIAASGCWAGPAS